MPTPLHGKKLQFKLEPSPPGKDVELSRYDAHHLLDALENIEISDGNRGFSKKEIRDAAQLLAANGIVSNPKIVNKRNLNRFVTSFRQAIRKMPADYKKNCRIVDCNGDPTKGPVTLMVCPGTEHEVCDDVVHSMWIYVTENQKGFKLVDAEYYDNHNEIVQISS